MPHGVPHLSGIPQTPEEALAMSGLNLEGLKNEAIQTPYDQARQQFTASLTGPLSGPGYEAQRREVKKGSEIVQTLPNGMTLYSNGTIYDPNQGVLYPPDPSSAVNVVGSDVWLRDIQDRWSDDKAAEWRKKLWDQGYQGANGLQTDEGGWGMDLVNALRLYHSNRYANYGKVQPLTPKGASTGIGKAVRDSLDPVAIRDEVRGWGQAVFGEDLAEPEAEFFAERIMDLTAELARKNPSWSPEQVVAGAERRVQAEFVKTPGVKGELAEMEEDEMDESLRSSIVSIAQVAGI